MSDTVKTYSFDQEFKSILKAAENAKKIESQIPKQMRTFAESKKSQKTVASLKVDKNDANKNTKSKEEGELHVIIIKYSNYAISFNKNN